MPAEGVHFLALEGVAAVVAGADVVVVEVLDVGCGLVGEFEDGLGELVVGGFLVSGDVPDFSSGDGLVVCEE